MGLEAATYISSLNASWPLNSDQVLQGDDHLRLLKSTLLNTFPSITGAISLTHTQLNTAAIKSERNVFSAALSSGLNAAVQLESTSPALLYKETDADVDEKIWRIQVTGTRMRFLALADDGNTSTEFFTVYRAGGGIVPTQIDVDVALVRMLQSATILGSVNIGHASDTTLARSRAGQLSMEGEEIGFLGIPQVSKSADYTATIAELGKCLYHPLGGGAGDTFTIPANASVAAAVGSFIAFQNEAVDDLEITINSDDLELMGSGIAGPFMLAQHGIAVAYKHTATKWKIGGVGLT